MALPPGPRKLARIASRCAHQFSRKSIERAQAYVAGEHIELRDPKDLQGPLARLYAAVRGSRARPYLVGIDLSHLDSEASVDCGCTCPFAAEGNLCKHVYAVLLALDASSGAPPPRATSLAGGGPNASPLALTVDPLAISRFDQRVLADRDYDLFGAPDPEPAAALSASTEDEDTVALARAPKPRGSSMRNAPSPKREIEEWQVKLFAVERAALGRPLTRSSPFQKPDRPRSGPIHYVLDVDLSLERGGLVVGIFDRQDGKSGGPRLRPLSVGAEDIEQFPDPQDRQILRLLTATPADAQGPQRQGRVERRRPAHESLVPPSLYELLLPALAATGRFEHQSVPLIYDAGPPWHFSLAIRREGEAGDRGFGIAGRLYRSIESAAGRDRLATRGGSALPSRDPMIGAPVDEVACDLEEPLLILAGGLIVFPGRIARLEAKDDFHWILMLRSTARIRFKERAIGEVFAELARMRDLPRIEVEPKERASFPWEIVRVEPEPHLVFEKPAADARARYLSAALSFRYGDYHTFGFGDAGSAHADVNARRFILRDREREREATHLLAELGASRRGTSAADEVDVRPKDFSPLVRALTAAGWYVEASGTRIRAPRISRLAVSSGLDWFDLSAEIDYGGMKIPLPELLRAAKSGTDRIRLGDGSEGLLPEEWLRRFAGIADLGEAQGDALRFAGSQAILLDLLLTGEAAADTRTELDETFRRAREKLAGVQSIAPRNEPRGFRGVLREYQKSALGWFAFLEDLGLGGCLADDMGLGKTVEVLALLQSRSAVAGGTPGLERAPSLVVAPRSLLHNWVAEAARFVPDLAVLEYSGPDRLESVADFGEYDLIITTYGTVRRDISSLQNIRFDYLIFDEAQVLKNPLSMTVKCCRQLAAAQRLALSGTPVENHLFELWSIFELLNPRMLGSRAEFAASFGIGDGGASAESLELLARALRPLILRRTKAQVLAELPEKTELTLSVELDDEEKRIYGELRDHYRRSLTEKIDAEGFGHAQMQVLEALLRLRQAACHPALIDPARADAPSSKLDALLEHLLEVASEGHKVLVFSQFVRLLHLVRARLEKLGLAYAYLDGTTRDRAATVARFEKDGEVKVFLISLKAGGVGLNLTAADYVFILDPWWNPAVEAQAIDRAHRIGQTRAVFAYRFIARGTVEEKILELHAKKKRLADAIVSEENAELGKLTAEDLELLLG